MRPHDHPRPPPALSVVKNSKYGWQAGLGPPVLQYYWLIDEEITQKIRDAVLKYNKGDVAQTTKYIDTLTEVALLKKHIGWTKGQEEEHGANLKVTFFYAPA